MVGSNVLLLGIKVKTDVRYYTAAAIASIAIALGGCRRDATPQGIQVPPPDVRDRVTREFATVDYYKPSDADADQAELRLAPLIVQQAGDARIAPVVYFEDSVARLPAGACKQRSFLWRYESRIAGQPTDWRGVRMTFDPRGAPIIWESLANDSRVHVIFVAKSLEEKAAKRFGPPLEGRQFSIERSVAEQPEVVVARVLSDGPEPMGPFVYLSDRRELTTVLCRCMPSQFSEIRETVLYRLIPLGAPTSQKAPSDGVPVSICDAFPEIPDCARPDWLELALRLPPDF